MKRLLVCLPALALLVLSASAQVITDEEYMNAYFVMYGDYLSGGGNFTKDEMLDVVEHYLTSEEPTRNLNEVGRNSGRMIGTILADAGVGDDCGVCDESTVGIQCCIYRTGAGENPMSYECIGPEVQGVDDYGWEVLYQCGSGCCGTKCCKDTTTTTIGPTPSPTADLYCLDSDGGRINLGDCSLKVADKRCGLDSKGQPGFADDTTCSAAATPTPVPTAFPRLTPPQPKTDKCVDIDGQEISLGECSRVITFLMCKTRGGDPYLSFDWECADGGPVPTPPGPVATPVVFPTPPFPQATPSPEPKTGCTRVSCGNGLCEYATSMENGRFISEFEDDPTDPCCCSTDCGVDCDGSGPAPTPTSNPALECDDDALSDHYQQCCSGENTGQDCFESFCQDGVMHYYSCDASSNCVVDSWLDEECPSVCEDPVSPDTWSHSCNMNLVPTPDPGKTYCWDGTAVNECSVPNPGQKCFEGSPLPYLAFDSGCEE